MSRKKAKENFQVYGLIDSLTGELRYVGCTIRGDARIKVHMRASGNSGNTHKDRWVRKLLASGGHVCDIILAQCRDRESVLGAEISLISYFRGLGFPLTNQTDGGEGRASAIVSEETRKKLSMAARHTKTDSERKKISLALQGHVLSQATRDKISATRRARSYKNPVVSEQGRRAISEKAKARWRGLSEDERKDICRNIREGLGRSHKIRPPVTDATRLKLSLALRGKKRTPETKAKLSLARKGKKLSEEHKAALRRGQANRPPMSIETRAKISEANRRRVVSPETRAKISAACILRRNKPKVEGGRF